MGLPQGGAMLVREAEAIVGGKLSETTKMPGPSFGLPAKACITGSKLRQIEGSVCSKCYALKGFYIWPGVEEAQYRRLAQLKHPRWIDAIMTLIQRSGCEFFRWHDAGDLQGVWHLENLCEVARRMPHVKFWLPTREKAFVRQHEREGYKLPKNLIVRVSSAMIGEGAMAGFRHTSGVVKVGATCPAPQQENQCKTCRRCWDARVKHVTYKIH
jgi:hypothetical protein